MNKLPIGLRDIPPYKDAVRITGTRPDGLPDGVHTGGAWKYNDLIYKPLDALPHTNCPHLEKTMEAECLEEMSGEPLFPHNWYVEKLNGRTFLVRKEAYLIPGELLGWNYLRGYNRLLEVEQAVRTLNRRGWEVGDAIQLAVDPDTPNPLFIVDLSNAHKRVAFGNAPDDEWRIMKLFRHAGADALAIFRERSMHVQSFAMFNKIDTNTPTHNHVYASTLRPINQSWARRLPDNALCLNDNSIDYSGEPSPNTKVHTWVLTNNPLDEDIIADYELTWGWSPIHQ